MLNPVLAPLRQRAIQRISPEAGNLVRLGNRRAWDFRVLGRAPVPTGPVFLGSWWLVPIEQDSSQIPIRACERVQAIYQAGLRPRTFMMAHEAPKLLSGPVKTKDHTLSLGPLIRLRQLFTRPLILTMATALFLIVVGPLLVKLLITLVMTLLAVLLTPLVLLACLSAIVVDPCLIAITDDGYWVEIDRWWS